jgi:asparagine synthase (glutamine-hydrolysing)
MAGFYLGIAEYRLTKTVAGNISRSTEKVGEQIMSVQFGRWSFEGQPAAPDYIEKVRAALAPYGPDSNESYSEGGVNILYRAFHTTKESRRETQPLIFASGTVIAWDGRLDNRATLISELRDFLSVSSTDVAIVAAAYNKWGTKCFAKLIGDWALAIWNPISRSLILAKDFVGTRHLYYSIDRDQVTWSTILDPLVLFEGKTFAICEEYIAGWFSMYPAVDLTPYVGIHSVPPSSFVLLRSGKHVVSRYWDFDSEKKIRYRTDAEYEEHFRAVFSTAVQHRLRSDRPVLADLSGGIDSSSIVCMADILISRGTAETPRLDTISWYNDSDPNNDERPYFTKVEEKRGRTGCHIDLATLEGTAPQKPFESEFDNERFASTPIPNRRLPERFQLYAAYMRSQGHRVALSGLGGEEATGAGVPTPTPELQDLLARARFIKLAQQVKAWASKMRKPRLPLLWEALRGFFPLALADVRKDMRPAPWLHQDFLRRNHAAVWGYPSRVKLFGPLPSFQNNLAKLENERRQQVVVNLWHLQSDVLRDVRYPYLDRDFLEFMYAIPREQIVRVGQRRALMKRALVGIVPKELLNRRRLAFVPQQPMKNISTEWLTLTALGQHMVSSSMGIIDASRFGEALQKAWYDQGVSLESLVRTLTLESWLHHLRVRGVLMNSMSTRSWILCSRSSGTSASRSAQNFS